jgi:type I restriction enzyme S subunit
MPEPILFKDFDEVIQNSKSIPMMRELIRQLAVQGRLVRQDPKDEPASVLLEKIKAEKARLVTEGKLKKDKPLPAIKPGEVPYELPEGWEWVRLESFLSTSSGGTPNRAVGEYYKGDIPWLKSGELKDGVIHSSEEYITQKGLDNSSAKLFPKGTLLIALYGANVGKTGLLAFDTTTNQAICGIFARQDIIATNYLWIYFLAIREKLLKISFGSAQPNISQVIIKQQLIPLAPLAEQQRIVTRVEELMTLCDRLEAQQKAEKDICLELNNSAIHQLVQSKDRDELTENWALINDNFDTLYGSVENVDKLQEAILQLAVRGRLVGQDPKDEPASVLLEKIRGEKARLVKTKKIRNGKVKYNSIQIEGNRPHIPKSWEWSVFDDVTCLSTGATPSTKEPRYWGGNIKWLSSGDIHQYDIYDCEGRITDEGMNNSNCKTLPVNSVLIALNGQGRTRATVAILRTEAACNQSLVAINPILNDSLLPEYIRLYLKANYYQIRDITGQKDRRGLNMGLISAFHIPIPPLAEQHRIVARVEELMALTNTLKEQIKASGACREELMRACVGEVVGI